MENEKFKSFRLSSSNIKPLKEWGIKEYKENALIAFLAGYIASISGIYFLDTIGGFLMLIGIMLEIIRIYKTISEKIVSKKQKIEALEGVNNNVVNQTGGVKKFKDILGYVHNYRFFLLAIIIAGGLFYWFQLRPTFIRQQCSWFSYTTQTSAEPARDEITKEEAELLTAKYRAEKKCTGNETGLDDLLCQSIQVFERPYIPARPAGPIEKNIREATKSEYEVCLRNNGLIE